MSEHHCNTKLSLKSYQAQTDSHSHDFHQLVLPVKGALALEIGHCGGEVDDHSAAVICASEMHAFAGSNDNQFIVADIPTQLAPAFERLPLFLQLDDSLKHYIGFLHTQLQLPAGRNSQLLERQMLTMLVQLLDQKFLAQHIDQRLLQARHFLERHFARSDAINSAAQNAALSPRHLRQLFAQHYQMSPTQYLLELRMQAAWQLLNAHKLSVQQVAEHCGYQNLSAFSDRFRKHFGTSPRSVRANTQD
ncbi:MAG: helix-turn-helix domain-containing protein [Pseudomonadales bacterium]